MSDTPGGVDATLCKAVRLVFQSDGQRGYFVSATHPLPVSLPDGIRVSIPTDSPLPVTIVGGDLTVGVDTTGLASETTLGTVYTRLADGSVRVGGTVAVSGPLTDAELRATAVPVSAAALPLPSGAATESTLATLATDAGLAAIYARLADGSARLGGTVAVSGAFFQATQPVSGPLTDAQLRATAVPVSGTFWQATQPISASALPLPSGASTETTLAAIKAKTDNLDVALSTRAVTGLTDTQLRATAVPVSLASLPALVAGSATIGKVDQGAGGASAWKVDGSAVTQPVSGPLTDAQLRATAVPVSGTFFQATQPVSGPLTDTQLRASAVPVSGPLTDTQLRATAVPVSGTFWQATQPISAAALPLPTGASTETTLAAIKAKTDNLDVALSTRAVTGLTDAQLRATAVPISAPTLTKGTQGSTGLSVQPLRDAGRTKCFITFRGTGGTSDALLSLVKTLGSTAAGGATSIAVTAGKTLCIVGALFSVKANAAAAAFARYTLRHNSAGAAVLASPDIYAVDLGLTAATVGSVDKLPVSFGDGFEFSGADQIAISAAMQATTNIIAITLIGYEY